MVFLDLVVHALAGSGLHVQKQVVRAFQLHALFAQVLAVHLVDLEQHVQEYSAVHQAVVHKQLFSQPLGAPAERAYVVSDQHQGLVDVVVPVLDSQAHPGQGGDTQLGVLAVWPGVWSKLPGPHCCDRRWVWCGREACCGTVVWRWYWWG